MKKVLFLINSLNGGGAERVLVNLVNNMDFDKYDITVQTMFKAGVNKQFLSARVKLIEGKINAPTGVSLVIKLMSPSLLEKYVVKDDFDIVVAYMHGAPTKLLWKYSDKKAKKIAWLHTDMKHSSLPKFFNREQVISCFNTFERIVGVSRTVCDSFEALYGLKEKLQVIYNTNDTNRIISMSNESINDFDKWINSDGVRIITVGRLGEEKGYDRLLRVCKRLKDDGKEYKLLILGDGAEKQNLNDYIVENNLENEVILGGFQKNPYKYVKNADLFVCSSVFEGLSTVMCESLILGTPVISTEVSGAKEVLGESNEYGVVVENDEEALYIGLVELIDNKEMLTHYRAMAKERAPFFSTENTVKAVEKLFEEVCNES